MEPTKEEIEPTKEQIGERIAYAIDHAPNHLIPGEWREKRRRAALALGVSDDTLGRYIKGSGKRPVSALVVWQIGQMTGQTFAWFAGQDSSAEDRLAVVAEHAGAQIVQVGRLMETLRAALAEAAAFRVDDPKLDRSAGVGEQRRKKPSKTVTVSRESAG